MKKYIGLVLFVGLSGFASAINYLTYPLLAHILSESQFVNITVALSLLTQIATFLSSIVALTVGITKAEGAAKGKSVIEQLHTEIMNVFFILVFVFLATAPLTLGKIGLPFLFAIPVSLLLLLSIPTSIFSGFMNGKGNLIKLGVIAVVTALSQFAFTVPAAVITKNSLASLGAMVLGQLLSLALVVVLYKKDGLPSVVASLKTKTQIFHNAHTRKLAKYALFSSLGVMMVNLLQVVDLIIFKNRPADAVFYTNLYVVSRVVFFVGIIFVWPLLSEINVKDLSKNSTPLLRLLGIITLIGAATVVALKLFGEPLISLLLKSSYDARSLVSIGGLAVLYKSVYVMLTAFTLYYTVLRRYAAFFVPALLAIATFAVMALTSQQTSTMQILSWLNCVAFAGLALYVMLFVLDFRGSKRIG